MKIILYTSPVESANEIALISELFELGVDYLYIRKPELDDFSLVDFVEKIPEKYWHKCISNSLIITKEFNLAGYHFTRDTVQKNELYNQKILAWLHQNNKISSVSAHSIEEIQQYKNQFKHIIVAPVFKSISKENHEQKWDYDLLKSTLKTSKNSGATFFAVGGVQSENIQIIKQMHFNGIGILGAIWYNNNSVEAKNQFNRILNEIM
jgi:thiamine-phosphate pyrophosphorylase